MSRVALLRVGIDSKCGGLHGPLFEDGSFDFMCIPGNYETGYTYGNLMGKHGKPLAHYFPKRRREAKFEEWVHLDPEFDTFTYGDPTTLKQSLRTLQPGDLLVFYAGMQEWHPER